MTIHVLDIPDDPAQLPRWLEQKLVGLDLAALVAELTAVHGAPAQSSPTVREVLGDQLDTVLASGLGGVSRGTLGYLMLRPQLLLELQELVFVSGGPYWDRVEQPSVEFQELIHRSRLRLEAFLANQTGTPRSTNLANRGQTTSISHSFRSPEQGERHIVRLRRTAAWYQHPALVSFATAAAVLFGVFIYEHNLRPTETTLQVATKTTWGWNKPGAIPSQVPADAHLNALADAAAEWFNERPSDPAGLVKRIGEFRRGCSVLLLADHKPLSDDDRQWLLERCRTWAGKLDAHLAAAESSDEVIKVRTETDETINKLIDSLRARAKTATAA